MGTGIKQADFKRVHQSTVPTDSSNALTANRLQNIMNSGSRTDTRRQHITIKIKPAPLSKSSTPFENDITPTAGLWLNKIFI
jgi:hypothetical protein